MGICKPHIEGLGWLIDQLYSIEIINRIGLLYKHNDFLLNA